jgi:hypothetical protein
MKKTIKLSETQLTNVVKRIISEQEMNDRVIKGFSIQPLHFQKYATMNLTPYYFETNGYDDCKMVEVTKRNLNSVEKKKIFLLHPEEYEKISELIDSTNNIAEKYLQKIKLLQEMIPSILVEKIMK